MIRLMYFFPPILTTFTSASPLNTHNKQFSVSIMLFLHLTALVKKGVSGDSLHLSRSFHLHGNTRFKDNTALLSLLLLMNKLLNVAAVHLLIERFVHNDQSFVLA